MPSVSRAEKDAHPVMLELTLKLTCVSHPLTSLVPRLQRSRLEI